MSLPGLCAGIDAPRLALRHTPPTLFTASVTMHIPQALMNTGLRLGPVYAAAPQASPELPQAAPAVSLGTVIAGSHGRAFERLPGVVVKAPGAFASAWTLVVRLDDVGDGVALAEHYVVKIFSSSGEVQVPGLRDPQLGDGRRLARLLAAYYGAAETPEIHCKLYNMRWAVEWAGASVRVRAGVLAALAQRYPGRRPRPVVNSNDANVSWHTDYAMLRVFLKGRVNSLGAPDRARAVAAYAHFRRMLAAQLAACANAHAPALAPAYLAALEAEFALTSVAVASDDSDSVADSDDGDSDDNNSGDDGDDNSVVVADNTEVVASDTTIAANTGAVVVTDATTTAAASAAAAGTGATTTTAAAAGTAAAAVDTGAVVAADTGDTVAATAAPPLPAEYEILEQIRAGGTGGLPTEFLGRPAPVLVLWP